VLDSATAAAAAAAAASDLMGPFDGGARFCQRHRRCMQPQNTWSWRSARFWGLHQSAPHYRGKGYAASSNAPFESISCEAAALPPVVRFSITGEKIRSRNVPVASAYRARSKRLHRVVENADSYTGEASRARLAVSFRLNRRR